MNVSIRGGTLANQVVTNITSESTSTVHIAPVDAPGSVVYWSSTGGTAFKGFTVGDLQVEDGAHAGDRGRVVRERRDDDVHLVSHVFARRDVRDLHARHGLEPRASTRAPLLTRRGPDSADFSASALALLGRDHQGAPLMNANHYSASDASRSACSTTRPRRARRTTSSCGPISTRRTRRARRRSASSRERASRALASRRRRGVTTERRSRTSSSDSAGEAVVSSGRHGHLHGAVQQPRGRRGDRVQGRERSELPRVLSGLLAQRHAPRVQPHRQHAGRTRTTSRTRSSSSSPVEAAPRCAFARTIRRRAPRSRAPASRTRGRAGRRSPRRTARSTTTGSSSLRSGGPRRASTRSSTSPRSSRRS